MNSEENFGMKCEITRRNGSFRKFLFEAQMNDLEEKLQLQRN